MIMHPRRSSGVALAIWLAAAVHGLGEGRTSGERIAASESALRAAQTDAARCSIHLELGKLYGLAHKYTNAREHLLPAYNCQPGFTTTYLLGLADYYLHDYSAAITNLKRAETYRSDFADLYYYLGLSYRATRDGAAIPSLQRAIQLAPRHAGAWCALSEELARRREFSSAIGLLQRYVKTEPYEALPRLLLGQAYYNHAEFNRALEAFQAAATLPGLQARAWYSIGATYLAMNNRAVARQWMERSLTVNPENPLTECRLGEIALAENYLDQAQAHFERSLALYSGYAAAHFGLGAVLEAKGNRARAIREYERGLQLDPENRGARYRLALIYQRAGQSIAARRQYDLLKSELVHDVQDDVRRLSVWKFESETER